MIRATIVKEVREVNYILKPEGWENLTQDQRKQYVLTQLEEGNIEDADVLETLSVYAETLRFG